MIKDIKKTSFFFFLLFLLLINQSWIGGTSFVWGQTDETTVTISPTATPTTFPTTTGEPISDEPDGQYPVLGTPDILESPSQTSTDTSFDLINTPEPSQTAVPALENADVPSPSPESSKRLDSVPDLPGSYDDSSILVKFKPGVSPDKIREIASLNAAAVRKNFDHMGISILSVPKGQVSRLVNKFLTSGDVVYAEPNYLLSAFEIIPNDPYYPYQYAHTKMQSPDAWAETTGSQDVVIAILDTGVDLDHPDLSAKIIAGIDFINDDTVADDDHGHGTHVAGIAAASSNNGIGVAGVAWQAKIMPIKVLDAAGNGSYAEVIDGIYWAVSQGADVINMSLGGTEYSQAMQDVVNYAVSQGVIVVAAAGNNGNNTISYPASNANVISVASTDSSNARSSFSNFNAYVDIAAPGSSIYSTVPNAYGYSSGTSMATPQIAGAAALIASLPAYSAMTGQNKVDMIWEVMRNTALDLGTTGRDDYFGYGLVQIYNAVTYTCFSLTSSISPAVSGTLTFNPLPACQSNTKYAAGTSVTVTANPVSDYYRFISWSGDLSGTEATTTIVVDGDKTITANFEQSTFADVPFSHPRWAHIQALYEGNYVTGYNTVPPTFGPSNNLLRAESSIFVLRGNYGTTYETPPEPWDVFGDDWSGAAYAEKWAEGMWNAGFTAGCQYPSTAIPKLFCPYDRLTRVQATVFGLRIKYGFEYVPPNATGTVFEDLQDVNYYGTKWAEQAYADGLLAPCSIDGSLLYFCPDELIDRSWMSFMVAMAKELSLPE
jgi:thermitase